MEIASHRSGTWQIFTIDDIIGPGADLVELRAAVKECLARDITRVAFAFGADTFLYTRSIGTLIVCHEMIMDRGGELAIVSPNHNIRELLDTLGYLNLVIVADSEDGLPQ